MMKFVHAADLHLDSPLRGLAHYPGAPVDAMRGATRRALKNLVDLCLEEEASLLLIAGDLYDGSWKDYSTGLFFAAQMSRLRETGTQVVWIRGNHDAASQITRYLRLPDHVRELSYRHPDTCVLESLGVAVHGQGFARREVSDDLARAYPARRPDLLNVGLLHTALTGREGHASYAPCNLETLASAGYDYWALGHVHTREVVSRDPWVVFPGNLQGRHARETGAKGASLVTVRDGKIVDVEHRALDVVRWVVCQVDAGEASSGDDVVELVQAAIEQAVVAAEDRVVAARVVVCGGSRAHGALQRDPERWDQSIRAAATDVTGEGAWVEKLILRTRDIAEDAGAGAGEDVVGQLVRALRAAREDVGELETLAGELEPLRRVLPHELREGEDGLALGEPDALRRVLDDVERELVPRLLRKGTDR